MSIDGEGDLSFRVCSVPLTVKQFIPAISIAGRPRGGITIKLGFFTSTEWPGASDRQKMRVVRVRINRKNDNVVYNLRNGFRKPPMYFAERNDDDDQKILHARKKKGSVEHLTNEIAMIKDSTDDETLKMFRKIVTARRIKYAYRKFSRLVTLVAKRCGARAIKIFMKHARPVRNFDIDEDRSRDVSRCDSIVSLTFLYSFVELLRAHYSDVNFSLLALPEMLDFCKKNKLKVYIRVLERLMEYSSSRSSPVRLLDMSVVKLVHHYPSVLREIRERLCVDIQAIVDDAARERRTFLTSVAGRLENMLLYSFSFHRRPYYRTAVNTADGLMRINVTLGSFRRSSIEEYKLILSEGILIGSIDATDATDATEFSNFGRRVLRVNDRTVGANAIEFVPTDILEEEVISSRGQAIHRQHFYIEYDKNARFVFSENTPNGVFVPGAYGYHEEPLSRQIFRVGVIVVNTNDHPVRLKNLLFGTIVRMKRSRRH